MNKGLISIGSNKDKELNLGICQNLLKMEFEDITFSKTSITEPYGNVYKDDFLNQLIFIYTEKDKDCIISVLKALEQKMGRLVTDKTDGKVIIDIDLIIWNDQILKPEDMKREYIRDLLPDLLTKIEDKPSTTTHF